MDFLPPFGQWLRQRRKTLGLTQIVLAQRLGYAVITLRKIEAANLRPSQQMAEALANTLQIPATDRESFVHFARGLALHLRYTNLPAPATSLVGRDRNLADLAKMLASSDTRLLSLLGPPGVGKTRLALALAQRVESDFQHGAVLVPLASLHQPDQVAPAIAQALDVRVPPDQPALDVLRRFLHDKHLLLILDNFEHLLDAAPVASELLATSPCLKVVATSRAPLRVVSEHTFDLQPLDVPNLQYLPAASALHLYSAVDLFVQRAHAVKPSFALTPANAPAVAEICQRLDGLPLAIELAAVRARAFTPQTMLAHLDHHIGASLRFLTSAPRDLPPRQQTLRHAIDWSYGLLSPDEQRLFCRLGIFAGGCTLQAAQTVCAWPVDDAPPESDVARNAVADALASLVEQSLVQETEGPEGESRYSMLETIREYALEQLEASGEIDASRARFVQHYAQLVQAFDPLVTEHRSDNPLNLPDFRKLQPDYANLLQAQTWCSSVFPEPLPRLRFLLSLAWIWVIRSSLGGQPSAWEALQHRITEAHDQCEVIHAKVQAAVLHRLAWLAYAHGDLPAAVRYSSELLAHCRARGTTAQIMYALYACGGVSCTEGRLDHAQALFDEQEQLARQTGSDYDLAAALGMKGRIALACDDLAPAKATLTEALGLARCHGWDWTSSASGNVYTSLRDLGLVLIRQNHSAQGMSLLEEALDFALQNQLALVAASCELFLAYGDLCQNHAISAWQRLRFSLSQYHRAFHDYRVPGMLTVFSWALQLCGRVAPAIVIAGAAAVHEALIRNISRADMLLQPDYLRILADSRSRLDDPALAAAWAEGQAMTLDQAVEYALSIAPD